MHTYRTLALNDNKKSLDKITCPIFSNFISGNLVATKVYDLMNVYNDYLPFNVHYWNDCHRILINDTCKRGFVKDLKEIRSKKN